GATDKIYADPQPEDGEGPRAHVTPEPPDAGGQSDQVGMHTQGKGSRNRFARSASPMGAEQAPGADALQPPLRSGFRARLRRSVRCQGRGEKPSGMLLWLRGSVACLTYQSRPPAEGTSLRCPASPTQEGERRMKTPQAHPLVIQGVRRRDLLKAGLAAGATLS